MKRLALTSLLVAVSIFGSACAKKAGNPPPPPGSGNPPSVTIPTGGGPWVPPGSGPGAGPGEDWEYGATVSLSVTSLSVMSQYTGRPMNNPTEIRLNLNLTAYGAAYGGTTSIGYKDNGVYHEGNFTSGDDDKSNKYNIWFSSSNGPVWHGVFEDYMGGLVVVIDQVVDLGDGQGPQDLVGGSVWFKNFGLTYAPHPPTYCWFVSLGPYDCRPWPKGDGMNTTSSVNPQGGYIKLGTFQNMSLQEAFNGELDL